MNLSKFILNGPPGNGMLLIVITIYLLLFIVLIIRVMNFILIQFKDIFKTTEKNRNELIKDNNKIILI